MHLADDPLKKVITVSSQFEALVRFLETRDRFVFDYETDGLAWHQGDRACGIAFGAWDDSGQLRNAYVPFRHRTGEAQLSIETIGPSISRLLANDRIMKIAHNLKFEDHFSRMEGWAVRGPRYCTMIAARLYDDNTSMKLEDRAASDLGIEVSRGRVNSRKL
jgi:DNA polymerase I-like protein with 3'-5' exonuclease and polymerase domains